MRDLPKDNRIVEGYLWSDPARAEVSVEKEFADDIGVRLGSTLRFDIQGVPLEVEVTSLRTVDWQTFGINFFLVVEPGVLEQAPQQRLAVARMPRAASSGCRTCWRRVPQRHPAAHPRDPGEDPQGAAPDQPRHPLPRRLHGGGRHRHPRRRDQRRLGPARPRGGPAEDPGHDPARRGATFAVEYALIGLVAGSSAPSAAPPSPGGWSPAASDPLAIPAPLPLATLAASVALAVAPASPRATAPWRGGRSRVCGRSRGYRRPPDRVSRIAAPARTRTPGLRPREYPLAGRPGSAGWGWPDGDGRAPSGPRQAEQAVELRLDRLRASGRPVEEAPGARRPGRRELPRPTL